MLSNLNLSLPLFLDKIPLFLMSFYFSLFEVWLAKISFYNIILVKSYRRKPLGLDLRPPPLDQEGLTLSGRRGGGGGSSEAWMTKSSHLYSQLNYSLISVLHYMEIKYEKYNTVRRLQREH